MYSVPPTRCWPVTIRQETSRLHKTPTSGASSAWLETSKDCRNHSPRQAITTLTSHRCSMFCQPHDQVYTGNQVRIQTSAPHRAIANALVLTGMDSRECQIRQSVPQAPIWSL